MKHTARSFRQRPLHGLLALVLLALTLLWPPGPYRTFAQSDEPPQPAAGSFVAYLPLVAGGGGVAPDLRFQPAAVELAPGGVTQVAVRVEPQADLRGATFELPVVQDGISSSFAATPDGVAGTLTITASAALDANERMLTVQGRSGLDTGKTWVGTLTVKTTSTTTAKTVFVDAVNGKDSNDGTEAKPVKTIKQAFTKVVSGDTVKLLPGQYNPTHSGDTFPLQVPSGVKIVGTLASNGAKQTFLSPATSAEGATGLTFAGSAAVKDLEMDVFAVAIQASKGTLTLTNLNLLNKLNLDLRGTAQATLSKSNVILDNNGIGAQVIEQAKFTMDAGKIGSPGNCNSARGVVLSDTAQATLKNGALLENTFRAGLSLNNSSKATLDGAIIRQTTPAACFSIGINSESTTGALSNATLMLNNTTITGADEGITLTGNEKVTITGGSISANGTGIEAGRPDVNPTITITGASVTNNTTGLSIGAPILKMRKSVVSRNEIGISVRGNVGFIGGGPAVDLGTDPSISPSLPNDPGNNDLSGNTRTAVSLFNSTNLFSVSGVFAVGNTWNANVQGADGSGHYPQRAFINGSSLLANGQNFGLPTDRKSIFL